MDLLVRNTARQNCNCGFFAHWQRLPYASSTVSNKSVCGAGRHHRAKSFPRADKWDGYLITLYARLKMIQLHHNFYILIERSAWFSSAERETMGATWFAEALPHNSFFKPGERERALLLLPALDGTMCSHFCIHTQWSNINSIWIHFISNVDAR